jgi:diguanylate cyclase (GGDEF)-like protein
VNNVDAQVKDRAAAMRATEDLKSYRRLTALSGNLMVLYYVNLENDYYTEFGATKDYDELGIAKQGYEFFRTTHENSLRAVHPDDLELFQSQVTKENILRTIDRDGMFALDYRLVRGDRSTYVRLKAARLQEDGKQILIIGILDEDARVRREQEVERSLSDAQRMATVDALTGVKNKRAYAQWEEKINAAIGSGEQEPFAVVVCDINDMKYVNDLYGHKEGDACLKRTSKRICDAFDHSPVFRVGGDEFVALLMGEDYDRREELVESVNELPRDLTSVRPGDTLSAGMVEYDKDVHHSLLSVFEAADQAMYERKQRVKSMLATVGYSFLR